MTLDLSNLEESCSSPNEVPSLVLTLCDSFGAWVVGSRAVPAQAHIGRDWDILIPPDRWKAAVGCAVKFATELGLTPTCTAQGGIHIASNPPIDIIPGHMEQYLADVPCGWEQWLFQPSTGMRLARGFSPKDQDNVHQKGSGQ